MKKSLIKELFYGEGADLKQMLEDNKDNLKTTSTYKEIEAFIKKYPELLKLHEKFIDKLGKEQLEDSLYYFTLGFRTGLFLGIECIEE